MRKYRFKRVKEHGYIITEDGHTMFPEDVKRRLDRLNYLEAEKLAMDQSRMLSDVREQARIVRERVEYHFRSTDGGFLPCPEMPFMKEFLGALDQLLKKIEHVG